jgi:diguanylate cyclase (GGDEF)-like protein/PAS domain S-box-containing protein
VKRILPHLFVVFALVAILLTGVPVALKNSLVDLRFSSFPRQASGNVVIVAIDSPSIEAIGVWPWPRRLHAELIAKLVKAGATGIAFDVDFSSPSTPESDRIFAEALKRADGSVILPSFEQLVTSGDGKGVHLNRPLRVFAEHAWPAVVNIATDPDGVVRRYPFGKMIDGKFLPSMGAVLAGQHESGRRPLRIDFSIEPASVPTISYKDVLAGDPATLARLADKKVLVGGTAIELGDRFNIPNARIASGVLVQALAAETILQDRLLRTSSLIGRFTGAGFVILLMLLLWRLSALARVAVLIGLAIAAEIGAMLVQAKFAIIFDTSLLQIVIAAYLVAVGLDEIDFRDLLGLIAERRFQRIAMSLGDGLVCTDNAGNVTIWNPTARAMFGLESNEIIGHPLNKICALTDDQSASDSFSVRGLPPDQLQAPGGKLMEMYGCRKDGELFPLEACFSCWPGTDGLNYGVIFRDISIRRREAARIRYLAEYDDLTGLSNRHSLVAHLRENISKAKPGTDEIALLIIGLDRYQFIIDTIGHAHGDQVLCGVAERFTHFLDRTTLAARLDGGEFAMVVEGPGAAAKAEQLSKQICEAFSENPLTVDTREHPVTVCIGLAAFPQDCRTADDLIGNAHLALYRAKSGGRGQHFVFERSIRIELEMRTRLESELMRALERNEFDLYYQPKVSLDDDTLVGVEALIRWRHPYRGLIAPSDFMHVAKTSPVSEPLALWVMRTACRQASVWHKNGFDLSMAINLAPSQIRSNDLATTIATVLKETGCPPSRLEVEVTEDILVDDENAVEVFRKIKDLGVRILLDDFGTGYASLTYLKKFPISGLKIDKSFVCQLQVEIDNAAIVSSTIGLSTLLGLSVIAEGIEDRATTNLLLRMGCKQGQGYFFGRPMPAAEFERKFLSHANSEKVTWALDKAG